MFPEISIRAEEIFYFGHWPITNTLLLSFFVFLLLSILAINLRKKLTLIPGKIQLLFELLIEQILKIMDSVLGERQLSEKYLPLIATIFIFVLTSNWLGLFPGVGSLEISANSRPLPLLRSPASDLNFTLALAIISVFSVNLLGGMAQGFKKYASKFFTLKNPIFSFVGLLEFISEFIKIISFSFRLFGNILAGEILMAIVSFLVPYFIPLPFIFLEIFVGFIQAFIFAMLTLVFISMAVKEETH